MSYGQRAYGEAPYSSLPASGSPSYSIVGATTLSLSVAGQMLEGRGIVGAVTLTLTPAAQLLEGRGVIGAVTVTLTPAAAMLEGRGIIGAAQIVVSPTAGMLYASAAQPAQESGSGGKARKQAPPRSAALQLGLLPSLDLRYAILQVTNPAQARLERGLLGAPVLLRGGFVTASPVLRAEAVREMMLRSETLFPTLQLRDGRAIFVPALTLEELLSRGLLLGLIDA